LKSRFVIGAFHDLPMQPKSRQSRQGIFFV
jgi:hypothetical protein